MDFPFSFGGVNTGGGGLSAAGGSIDVGPVQAGHVNFGNVPGGTGLRTLEGNPYVTYGLIALGVIGVAVLMRGK